MIKKGDLVMVVSDNGCPCPSPSTVVGKVAVVESFAPETVKIIYCSACKNPIRVNESVAFLGGFKHPAFAVSRLKKIDPPSTGELDGVPVRKDVEAPIKGIPEEAVSK